jgi:predicted hydrolase (HD superfamily)
VPEKAFAWGVERIHARVMEELHVRPIR